MDAKKVAFGLGVFSIALGAAEVFKGRSIAAALGEEEHTGVVRGFGARELLAGASLLAAPAVATNVWNRVAGDVMDIASLGAAARKNPDNKTVWGSLAFVLAVTAVDVVTAIGLDRTTGKTLPTQPPLPA
jgi:hypothetical protein